MIVEKRNYMSQNAISFSNEIDDNDVVVVDVKNKCYPSITFKSADGVTEIFYANSFADYKDEIIKRVEEFTLQAKFSIGDIVYIKNSDKSYTTYTDWFKDNDVSYELAVRYCYGVIPTEGRNKFRIVAVGPHAISKQLLYAVTMVDGEDKRIYLMGEEGISK